MVFKKSSKLWHFSWKSCYFQMKKAPFWKWCFVWSNRCWKCIYHVCSFLAIYFQPSAIKSNLFWCSFFLTMMYRKHAEKMVFCQIFRFLKNQLEKWILCAILNFSKKFTKKDMDLIFFSSESWKSILFKKRRLLQFDLMRARN